MTLFRTTALTLALLSTPALAFEMPQDEETAQFVTSNVISTFYHELGHALIDVLELPVLGKEEDAADMLSSVLTHNIWDEEAATQITYDTANAFALWADDPEGWDSAFADTHSLDQQRYYTLVCLYYGADPAAREDVAIDLELPEDRAAGCADEFTQAEQSWAAMLEGLEPGPKAKGLVLVETDDDDPVGQILAAEIADLNKTYGLPRDVQVSVEDCGEANAFYLPGEYRIILCREYAEEMVQLWETAE
jgi:Putative metallopeptidase